MAKKRSRGQPRSDLVIIVYLSGKEEHLHAYDKPVVLIVHFVPKVMIGQGVRHVQAPMELIMDDMFEVWNTPLVQFAARNAKNIISIIRCETTGQLSQLVCVK